MHHQLNAFDRERLEGTRISLKQIHSRREQLWGLRLAERRKISGLPPNRADVILFGALIFEVIMETFHLPELYISTRGLRFGVVQE